MASLTVKTRSHLQTFLLVAGVIGSLWLFRSLLLTPIHPPLALLACGALMLASCCVGLLINPPPTGAPRAVAWGGIGFFAVGMVVAASVMHWEVSGR